MTETEEQITAAHLWAELMEASLNLEPGELADLCVQWAGELRERFQFDPPMDGWVSL